MKKMLALLLIFLPLFSGFSHAGNNEVWKDSRTVRYTGGSKTITVVWANLNSDRVRIESVLADDQVGQVAPLGEIVKSGTDSDGTAIAGINGTFFSAYTDFQPFGVLISDGSVKHLSTNSSVLAVEEDGTFHINQLHTNLIGSVNGQWDWPYNWYAWNINHFYTDPKAVMVFTPDYNGPKPKHDFSSVEVTAGIITKIGVGSFNIPKDGFLLLTKDSEMLKKFIVGQKAAYKVTYTETDFNSATPDTVPVDYSEIRTMVGAGPTLVEGGKIVLNAAKEGFTEAKILTDAGQRSLIGVTKDGILGMTSVPGVTMAQLAEIALQLGMVEAMNLDGGASSGVYYNGSYIVEPGREISNALVVKVLYDDPIHIQLNGRNLVFDADPYINKEFSRTLVPLRGISEALGVTVIYDTTTSSILLERYGTKIILKSGSNIVYVNGVQKQMDVAVTIRDGRAFVQARSITEFFGGLVDWDGATSTVLLTIDDVQSLLTQAAIFEKAGDYENALSLYIKVLTIDAKNITAAKQIAAIYNTKLKDKESSIPYY